MLEIILARGPGAPTYQVRMTRGPGAPDQTVGAPDQTGFVTDEQIALWARTPTGHPLDKRITKHVSINLGVSNLALSCSFSDKPFKVKPP